MTDDEWAQIKPAAEALELARRRLDAAGSRNHPRGITREAIEVAAELDRLAAEAGEAKRNYDEVQQRVLGKIYSL